jgi:hypothetical protein
LVLVAPVRLDQPIQTLVQADQTLCFQPLHQPVVEVVAAQTDRLLLALRAALVVASGLEGLEAAGLETPQAQAHHRATLAQPVKVQHLVLLEVAVAHLRLERLAAHPTVPAAKAETERQTQLAVRPLHMLVVVAAEPGVHLVNFKVAQEVPVVVALDLETKCLATLQTRLERVLLGRQTPAAVVVAAEIVRHQMVEMVDQGSSFLKCGTTSPQPSPAASHLLSPPLAGITSIPSRQLQQRLKPLHSVKV